MINVVCWWRRETDWTGLLWRMGVEWGHICEILATGPAYNCTCVMLAYAHWRKGWLYGQMCGVAKTLGRLLYRTRVTAYVLVQWESFQWSYPAKRSSCCGCSRVKQGLKLSDMCLKCSNNSNVESRDYVYILKTITVLWAHHWHRGTRKLVRSFVYTAIDSLDSPRPYLEQTKPTFKPTS